MTLFAHQDGRFGMVAQVVRLSIPEVSLPLDLAQADLSEFGWSTYEETPPPAAAWDERPVEVAPVEGLQQWALEPNGRTVEDCRAQCLALLADRRWQASQAFTYDGVTGVPADSALSAVTGFVVAAQIMPPEGTTVWKLAPGVFRAWTFNEVVAYGMAIRAHIQACFDREEALTTHILAADDPTSIDITTGWPG